MKVLITKKETCGFCDNGKIAYRYSTNGWFNNKVRYEECVYCQGTGYTTWDEVVEVDKDLRT